MLAIKGIPEEEWTPWQLDLVRNHVRMEIRDRQWLRIEKWRTRQQQLLHCICLADIADWCARRPGDIERDPLRRMQAYGDLQDSILLGEFGNGRRLKVIYLPTQPPSLRDRVRLRINAQYLRAQSGRQLGYVLDLCWAPRELCLRWLLGRHIDPPPWLAAEPMPDQPARVHELNKPDAIVAAPSLTRAKNDRIHAAIAVVYARARGKPPNLKEVVPLVKAELLTTNETATWKQIEACAKDKRHSGKRRDAGRTLKCEQTRRLEP